MPLAGWVLGVAFERCHSWHERGLDEPLSVNLSAHDRATPLPSRCRPTAGLGLEYRALRRHVVTHGVERLS